MKKTTLTKRAVKSTVPVLKKPLDVATPTTPFNWLVIHFVGLFFVNSIILYAVNMIFPQLLVLGTHVISPLMALVSGSALLSLLLVAAMPITEAFQKAQKFTLTTMQWTGLYFILNFIGLWLISRLAEEVGLGVSSWMVAAGLAVVLDCIQAIVISMLMKKMK